MPTVLVAGLALTAIAAAIAGCEEDPDAAGRATPARDRAALEVVLGCARRVEGAPGLPVFDRRQDLAAGPVVLHGLKGEARRARRSPGAVARRYERGEGAVKVLAGVRAGTRPTVTIAPAGRTSAGLLYGVTSHPRTPRYGLDMAQRSVEFRACPRDEPRFSSRGPVGPRTHFAGGFLIARAHCMRLLVSTPGRPPRQFVLAYGVPPRSC